MMARAIPLNTDSMTFRNWAQEGNGASLTIGQCSALRLRFPSGLNGRTSTANIRSAEASRQHPIQLSQVTV